MVALLFQLQWNTRHRVCGALLDFALWNSTPACVADWQSFFSAIWRLYLEGANAWLDVIVCMAAVGTNTSSGMTFTFGGDTDGKENRGHVPSIGGANPSAARSGEGRVTPLTVTMISTVGTSIP